MASAEVQSRSPVTAAGGIVPNSLSASPAPNCTETIPVKIMAAGSTTPGWATPDRATPDRATPDLVIPDWIFRKWIIRKWTFRDGVIRDGDVRS